MQADAAPDPASAPAKHTRTHSRYYAFLSYSHRDRELADWLFRELEKFRVPKSIAGRLTENGVVPRRLTPIFRDEQELAAAHDLGEEIRSALSSSHFLIVLCSPNSAKSHWTNAEIETFKRTHSEANVLAAIASGEPFASEMPERHEEECFPPALRQKFDRRGRPTGKRAEPLAADLRGNDEVRRLGFLKLVAGMLGVGLDDLVQRATTRRHRQMAWLAAASLGGMAVTSTLAVTAIQGRDAARDQRREAEGLVAYMVGDLKDKLEPIGKLDALDGVASRVLAYYSKQDASELSDAALIQRSRALSITAQVAYLRGRYEQARALYRQALAGTEEAVRRTPDDPQPIFEQAQNAFWLGEIARMDGQADAAIEYYRQYKQLADRLVQLAPDNLKWRMEALYGAEDLGISLYNKRRYDQALAQFQGALSPMQNLMALDPANGTYRVEMAKLMGWLADSNRALGRLNEAIATRTREIAFLNEALARSPSDVGLLEQVIYAHQGLGNLLVLHGQAAEGIAEFRLAVANADHLLPVEPTNALWKGAAATAHLELAKALLATHDRAAAEHETGAACALVAALGGASDRRQSGCLAMQARLALDAGDGAEAAALARQALSAARHFHAEDPNKDKFYLAGLYRLTGDALQRSGDRGGAMSAWASALAILPADVPELSTEIDEHALILERLGRAEEARPLKSALKNMGYTRPA
ncbi:TIR domain-containing protein [Sphingomonas limnosediminicola]|uniref:TIR domain-containing protein n=1 Tax=Sphingomonas limnosediminicola TaxID=940133 RepID=A0ABP7LFW0_9SPHN